MSSSETVPVTIEIPRASRNKYEIDHETGRIHLDRRLNVSMVYPADYGFIENTLAGDGDPIDALVLNIDPVFPGVICDVRPIGVMLMNDEAGEDHKLICVPAGEAEYADVKEIEDLRSDLVAEIEHFFTRYKDLEKGKFVEANGFADSKTAWAAIKESQAAYKG